MSDITNEAAGALKGHIGKFPIWLVALVIVGALAVFWYFYSRSGSAAAPAATPVTDATGYSTDGLPAATSDSADTSAPDTSANALLGTNQAWLSKAAAGVSAAFGTSQTTVYSVLYNYVNGLDWSPDQQKFIDRALADYGTPPEGTSGLGSAIGAPVATPSNPVVAPAPPSVVVVNPAPTPTPVTPKPAPKPTPKPTPTPPAKTVTKPTPVNVATAPIGAKVTLSRKYSGYITADAANKGGKATVTTGTGTYYVFNRAARSHGEMVNVTRVKGVPGAWINP